MTTKPKRTRTKSIQVLKTTAQLTGSTVIATELDAKGREADDRLIAVVQLADGRTWRASRTMLRHLGYTVDVRSETYDVIRAHKEALDDLAMAEYAKDDLASIAQDIRSFVGRYDGILPDDEVLRAIDPRRIRDEIRAKAAKDEGEQQDVAEGDEHEQQQHVAGVDVDVTPAPKEVPQVMTLRLDDLL